MRLSFRRSLQARPLLRRDEQLHRAVGPPDLQLQRFSRFHPAEPLGIPVGPNSGQRGAVAGQDAVTHLEPRLLGRKSAAEFPYHVKPRPLLLLQLPVHADASRSHQAGLRPEAGEDAMHDQARRAFRIVRGEIGQVALPLNSNCPVSTSIIRKDSETLLVRPCS